MDFLSMESQLLVLFLGVAVGYAVRKLKIMNDEFDASLSRLILDVSLPCMIVGSVVTSDTLPSLPEICFIMAVSFASYALVIALAVIIPLAMRAPKTSRGVYSYIISFGNVGFIGLPVLSAVFGQQAVVYASILNIPFNLLVFTIGVLFLADGSTPLKERLRTGARNLKSPCTAACVLVVILAPLNVTSTGVVGDTLVLLGSITTPAALLVVGSSLAKAPVLTMVDNWRAWIAVAGRLVIAPLAVYFAFRPFVSDPLLLGTLVIVAAMPVATNGTLLCLRFGADSQVMLQGTFVSTVLSVITIPLIAMLVV